MCLHQNLNRNTKTKENSQVPLLLFSGFDTRVTTNGKDYTALVNIFKKRLKIKPKHKTNSFVCVRHKSAGKVLSDVHGVLQKEKEKKQSNCLAEKPE